MGSLAWPRETNMEGYSFYVHLWYTINNYIQPWVINIAVIIKLLMMGVVESIHVSWLHFCSYKHALYMQSALVPSHGGPNTLLRCPVKGVSIFQEFAINFGPATASFIIFIIQCVLILECPCQELSEIVSYKAKECA